MQIILNWSVVVVVEYQLMTDIQLSWMERIGCVHWEPIKWNRGDNFGSLFTKYKISIVIFHWFAPKSFLVDVMTTFRKSLHTTKLQELKYERSKIWWHRMNRLKCWRHLWFTLVTHKMTCDIFLWSVHKLFLLDMPIFYLRETTVYYWHIIHMYIFLLYIKG